MRRFLFLLLLLFIQPANADNIIRNGSFELPFEVGSTKMLQGQEPMQYHWGDGLTMFISWQPFGVEGWWSVGLNPGEEHLKLAHQARSDKQAAWLNATDQPVGIVCGAGQILPSGSMVFSIYVRTENATGRVRFDCLNDNSDMSGFLQETVLARAEVALPENTNGQWTRLDGKIMVPASETPLQMAVRVHLEKGTLMCDDVQVEPGEITTDFNVRPAEQIKVNLDCSKALPVFVCNKDKTTTLTVTNAGMQPLSGELSVHLARWDGNSQRIVVKKSLDKWPAGATLEVKASLQNLRPDAYLVYARLRQNDATVIDGMKQFDGAIDAGGMISRAMVQAPCVARFALADARPNNALFGSGNMMVNTGGGWWGGYPVADYIDARKLGFGYSREQINDDSTYRLAAGGMRSLGDGPKPWTAPDDLPDELRNPIKKNFADLSNPEVWPYIERMWRKLALDTKDNPIFPLIHITGEDMVLYQGGLCPTDAADVDFRDWVKTRYGTLEAVTDAWGRPVNSWAEIEQIISARMVREQIVAVEKEQERRLDWLGAADKLNAEQAKFLQADPGRGLDWLRWRNDIYLRSVERVAKIFHEVNSDTLLSNHFCWPNFVPQTMYGLARHLDALGIDTQYPCGVSGSLGTPAETMDMLGIYEAFADSKPVWGMEIYIQPKFPAEMPAAQIWGFIAHGMDVVNNFAWKPYSDAGINAKRWNEPGAPPWWFVIDFDNSKMPQFAPLVRATREVNTFNAKYDGSKLKRVKPVAALFVSEDAGILSHFQTRGQWWESPVLHARCELGWLLRLNGVSLDYLDDGLLVKRLQQYKTVFIPYSPNINDKSLALLADFARNGGTVVFAGPSGWQDPWLKSRANVGGKAFAELNWTISDFSDKPVEGIQGIGPLAIDAPLTALNGMGKGNLPGGKPLMQSATGEPVAWHKPFGKGRVIALSAYPSAYIQSPHADASNIEFISKLVKLAGITPQASWESDITPTPEKSAGEGAPVVDVMLRQKSQNELFLFVNNMGGEGQGIVKLNLGRGWKSTDTLTGAPVTRDINGHIPMTLKAWEYRVIRLTK